MFVSGIILAAGASTRLGRPKQLLPVDGKPLLQHVLDEASAAGIDELVLVLGHEASAVRAAITLPPDTRVVVNDEYAAGQSTSLRAGLRAADERSEAAAVLLGDCYGLTRDLIAQVVAHHQGGAAPITRPLYASPSGKPVPGHPVVLGRSTWAEAEKIEGDQGARQLIAAHPEWVDDIHLDVPAPDDIDTEADYQRIAGRAPATRKERA